MTDDRHSNADLVLLAVRLADTPATGYYVAHRELAGRLAADRITSGGRDGVRVLPLGDLAIGAAVDPRAVRPNQLHLLGVLRDDGAWVQPGRRRRQ